MSGGRGPAEGSVRGGSEGPKRPAGEDAILRTGSCGETRSAEAAPAHSPVPYRMSQGRRDPKPRSRDEQYRGWLPGYERLTPGELFAGFFAAGMVCLVLSASLAFAGSSIELPAPVAGNETPLSLLGGLATGLYVSARLSGARLVRRKHLRGER